MITLSKNSPAPHEGKLLTTKEYEEFQRLKNKEIRDNLLLEQLITKVDNFIEKNNTSNNIPNNETINPELVKELSQ